MKLSPGDSTENTVKVAIINFSGNVGKTTVARQLLAPRLRAPAFCIESLNASDGDEAGETERMRGREFGDLQEELMLLDSAIVDIGASNVEDVIRLMGQFEGSHEEFDYFVVPTVSERKQQIDTIHTIETLAGLGVPPSRIRLLFNKVEMGDGQAIAERFSALLGFHAAHACFRLRLDAALFRNEIFERLRVLNKSVAEVAADTTDYRAQLRDLEDPEGRAHAVSMISVQRLARSAQRNLDAAYLALFEDAS